MEKKAYAAFGYMVCKNIFTAGETFISDPVFDNKFSVGEYFPYIWLYTKGRDVLINTATNDVEERFAGDSTISKPYPIGDWTSTLPVNMELFCISGFANSDRTPPLPNVSIFKLSKNQNTTVENGTKLFLAEGALNIASTNYVGVNQIRFTTGDKTVTAIEDSYGFIFP